MVEVTEERNGPSGLRDDDDDDVVMLNNYVLLLERLCASCTDSTRTG